jgi:hypothetical protein
MAFGLSSKSDAGEMIGADVVVADFTSGMARARDFFLQAAEPCNEQDETGVCPDTVFYNGHDNVAYVFGAEYRDGDDARATVIHYSRPIQATDAEFDRSFDVAGQQTIVFAIGSLGSQSYPTGHRVVATAKKAIEFGRKRAQNCAPLIPTDRLRSALIAKSDRDTNSSQISTRSPPSINLTSSGVNIESKVNVSITTPGPELLHESGRQFPIDTISDRVLTFTLGPSGTDQPPVIYYVNGRPAPILRLRRGLNYTFQIMTGRDERDPLLYHPVAMRSGLNQSSSTEPMIGPAKGRLCLWSSSLRRQDVPKDFAVFAKSLAISCDQGPYDYFTWTPDRVTPETLQYCSMNAAGIGGLIQIVH